ncbi:hypothetical protein BVIET440_110160 [Burkholderia vietnamiensis]
MPGLPRMGNDLLNLGRRDVPRIDPTYPSPFAMDLQHDLRGRLAILLEILLDDHDDELHWREVVVEQHHLVHRRRLELLLLAFQDGAVLLVRDNRHTPILNNSDRPAILPLPDRQAGALRGSRRRAIVFVPYESRLRCRLSRVARNTNRQEETAPDRRIRIQYPTSRDDSIACHSSLVYEPIMRLFKCVRSAACCEAKPEKP